MARIAGINVPDNKHAVIALTAIYGVGRTRSQEICAATGIAERGCPRRLHGRHRALACVFGKLPTCLDAQALFAKHVMERIDSDALQDAVSWPCLCSVWLR